MDYSVEINKLAEGLAERGIEHTVRKSFDGLQIVAEGWDVICHQYSYGGDRGLLEAMGTIVRVDYDDVEGYLTAEEILKRIDESL